MPSIALNPALWQPAPRVSTPEGKAAPAAAKEADVSKAATMLETWEATRRQMQEEFMSTRLETAEMIMEALRPHAALWAHSGPLARAMAGTVEHLSAEINSVVRDMEAEFGRRAVPGAPLKESEGFTNLFKQADRALRGASFLVLTVGASFDRGPLNRESAFERAMNGAWYIDDARSRLDGLEDRYRAALKGGVNLQA